MSYFKDLTEYEYGRPSNALNVGWLSNSEPYTEWTNTDIANTAKQKFIDKFNERRPEYESFVKSWHKGIHHCEFCNASLGNFIIKLVGQDDKIYAVPSEFMHYVTEHNYMPPIEFIGSVLFGPKLTDELLSKEIFK